MLKQNPHYCIRIFISNIKPSFPNRNNWKCVFLLSTFNATNNQKQGRSALNTSHSSFDGSRLFDSYLRRFQWIPEPGSCWPPAQCPQPWEQLPRRIRPPCPSPPTWVGPSSRPSYWRKANQPSLSNSIANFLPFSHFINPCWFLIRAVMTGESQQSI